MAEEGFTHRFKQAGLKRILTGYDLISASIVTILVFFSNDVVPYHFDGMSFINNATSMAVSLTAVIITGTAILVALTDKEFLALLKRKGIYNNLLFVFEYTTLLSILVSVSGIVLQSFDYFAAGFYVFLFLYSYLLFATAKLVSNIVTFGDRKGDVELVKAIAEMNKENHDSERDNSERLEEVDQ